MAAKQWLQLVPLLRRAVDAHGPYGDALDGVAVLGPGGEPVGYAGALARYEVRALAALVSRDGPPDLLRRLFEGELAATTVGRDTRSAGELATTMVGRDPRSAGEVATTTVGRDTRPAGELATTTVDRDTRSADELTARSLEHRTVFLGIAGRCVFVVALAAADLARSRIAASDLRDEIERLIRDSRAALGETWVPPLPDPSGSGSPAEAFAWPPRPRAARGTN